MTFDYDRHLWDPRYEVSNKHIRVTLSDEGKKKQVVFHVFRDAFMLSPVLRENLPTSSDGPTRVALYEYEDDFRAMSLLLSGLEDLAQADKKDDFGENRPELDQLEDSDNSDLMRALVLADKYEVTRLFKTFCLVSCLRSSQLSGLVVSRALCMWDPGIAKIVMLAATDLSTDHPALWDGMSVESFGWRHWRTLVSIVHNHPDVVTAKEDGAIDWPAVAEHFPWKDKKYWELGPANHDVVY